MPDTVTDKVTIVNRLGLHARPAMLFVETAARYQCEISVSREDDSTTVDGKAILQMMLLAATSGTELRITERLTRVSEDTIDYEISVEDPVVLTGPWKAAYPLKRDPQYRFFEYGCHEDNRTIRDFINSSRAERGLL